MHAFRGRPDTRTFGDPTPGVPTANEPYRLSDGAPVVLTVAREADRNGRLCDGPVTPDADAPETGGRRPLRPVGPPLRWCVRCSAFTRRSTRVAATRAFLRDVIKVQGVLDRAPGTDTVLRDKGERWFRGPGRRSAAPERAGTPSA